MKITIALLGLLLIQVIDIDAHSFRGVTQHDDASSLASTRRLGKDDMGKGMGKKESEEVESEEVEEEEEEEERAGEVGGDAGAVGGLPQPDGVPAQVSLYPLVNDNGLMEEKECAQPWSKYVETARKNYEGSANIRDTYKSAEQYQACYQNQCNSGCCRIHFTGLVCDTDNEFYTKQCVCNARTQTKATAAPPAANTNPGTERIPVVVPEAGDEDRNTNENAMVRGFRTCTNYAGTWPHPYANDPDETPCYGDNSVCPNGCCLQYTCICGDSSKGTCVDPNEIDIPGLGDIPGLSGGPPQNAESAGVIVDIKTADGDEVVIDLGSP